MSDLPKIEAYSGDGEYIFVSYAHKDRDIVYPIIAALQKNYNVWFDEGIRYGKEWEPEIAENLKNCSIFMFMVTDNSLNSENCKDELYRARDMKKDFLNILISKETILPEWFLFRYGRFQMCNYYTFSSSDEAVADIERKCDLFNSVEKDSADHSDRKSLTSEEMYQKGKQYYDAGEYEKAVEWYTKAAELGNTSAQCDLGYCYDEGHGVPQSYEKAVEWYTKAAEQGDAQAQCNLGVCYSFGQGVQQSYEKAIEWCTKAAEQGNDIAQYNLGYCYEHGYGVPQSYEKAVEWYTKAAEQGDADAQNQLGCCYENGDGVPQSYEKAIEWYTKAAKQGHVGAQDNLDHCYCFGQGVPQIYEKAVKWYTKAAEQGDADAQNDLGLCYETGTGVPQSDEKAAYWYARAKGQTT